MLAVMVKENDPTVVGVPDMSPLAEFNVSPEGSDPDVTANVAVGVPLAVSVNE